MTQPRGILLVLVGPSGVGKSTVARLLSERLQFRYIISATTRPRRPGDEKGKTYDHITREEFEHRLEAGEFLEFASVFDDLYATPRHPALDYLAAGDDVLMEIDVQGALQVKDSYPDALLVFLLPPTEQTLLQRLTLRGREDGEQIRKRFRNARREIAMARGSRAFDAMVVNDNLESCVTEIVRLVEKRKKRIVQEQI
jgi:guanylate kinase